MFMSLTRSLLLAASQNRWLREHATRYRFVRSSVSRFMPGETFDDAMQAAQNLSGKQIGTVFTHLGENIRDHAEAQHVADHYLDATLDLYRRTLGLFPNVGVCLQAYLFRTRDDLSKLLTLRPSIRLVKGAYNESAEIAFPRKQDVDENYFALAKEMLIAKKGDRCVRAAFGTHDLVLIRRLSEFASAEQIQRADFEVQMLYGIQRAEQERLAAEGCTSIVLVAYGSYWYPWFVRRLAERPANLWFMVRNVFAG